MAAGLLTLLLFFHVSSDGFADRRWGEATTGSLANLCIWLLLPATICIGATFPLAVRALAGAPGIYSARWAGPDKDFGKAMARVWQAVQDQAPPPDEGEPDLAAHFVCALALAWPDGRCDLFEGEVHGRLAWPPRGSRGFGYDPMFVAEGQELTFGEMEPAEKHAMSHRANAFRLLLDGCFALIDTEGTFFKSIKSELIISIFIWCPFTTCEIDPRWKGPPRF